MKVKKSNKMLATMMLILIIFSVIQPVLQHMEVEHGQEVNMLLV